MYPTGCVPPKFYGLPKIHKPDTTLRPIVYSCGSVTYGVAKEHTKILKPLVGKSPHHINSTHDFVEQVKHINLAPWECLSCYDVSALFTSVPVDPALNVIKDLLEKGPTLKERTILPVEGITLLLEFCLKNAYFSFQGQFYEQVKDVAMGSPVSPIVANLYVMVVGWHRYTRFTGRLSHQTCNLSCPYNLLPKGCDLCLTRYQVQGDAGSDLPSQCQTTIVTLTKSSPESSGYMHVEKQITQSILVMLCSTFALI